MEGIQDVADFVSVIVYCLDDDSFMLTQDPKTLEFWIPSTKVVTGVTWRSHANDLIRDVVLDSIPRCIARLYKVWKPYPKGVSAFHAVFGVVATTDKKTKQKEAAARSTKYRTLWMTQNELQRSKGKARSRDLFEIMGTVKRMVTLPFSKIYEPAFGLSEVVENDIFGNMKREYEKLLEGARFTKQVQTAIYVQFLLHSFPCLLMGVEQFASFISKLAWAKDKAPLLFKAADMQGQGYIDFRDFLHFLAATEPGTPHRGPSGEFRSRYIFRYYDRDNDNMLGMNDFRALFNDVAQNRSKSPDAALIARDAEAYARSMGADPNRPIDLNTFVRQQEASKAGGAGAALLLRSPRTVMSVLGSSDNAGDAADVYAAMPYRAPVEQGVRRRAVTDYHLALHYIKLTRTTNFVDSEEVFSLPKAMSKTSIRMRTPLTALSKEALSKSSVHNEILRGLQYFVSAVTPEEAMKKPGRKSKSSYSWGFVDPAGFANCLLKVCDRVKAILRQEPRLLQLRAPVFILGDLHGNFTDMMHFEKSLWHLGPSLCPATLLFLGDYVDRGPHGVELIAYLFAYKIQSPQKVMMLRGNHEIRDIQMRFTFREECQHKFGESIGKQVWEAINDVMNYLPLAAVIDGKVFCAHGGIPPPWLCPTIPTINSIPCPLSRPEEQSPLAWELIWNDPFKGPTDDNIQMELQSHDGFARNRTRGTGHWFSSQALEKFLSLNELSLLVRAHQVQMEGFFVEFKSLMISVFSASKYCNGTNEAACLLVDNGRVRVFRSDS